ncbi:MAG: endospore germination permease [Firmicutes bacterium]|nr:endospore germination permease [Bacillota bacterium]
MMPGGHIDKRQLAVLITLDITGSYFLVAPRVMAKYAGPAGWIGILVGSLSGVGLGALLIALHRHFPTRDFIGMSELILGRHLGKLWSLVFFGYAMSVFLIIREFSTTILTPFLPESPIGPVIAIMTVIIAYLAYSGIESIARTAQVFLPFIAISLLLILATALAGGDLGRIQPWLGKGLAGIGLAGLNAGAVFGELVLFLAIFSHLRRTKDDVSGFGWGLILGTIPLTLVTISGISLYGHQGVTRLTFPAISIAQLIRLGRYFERMEAVFIIIWFILSMLKIGLIIYTATVTLAGILELKRYQPLVLPTAVLAVLLSLQPKTDYSVLQMIDFFTNYTLPVTLLLPGLLLVVASIRKVREPGPTSQKQQEAAK